MLARTFRLSRGYFVHCWLGCTGKFRKMYGLPHGVLWRGCAVFGVLASTIVWAEPGTRLRGVVVDPAGAAVPKAELRSDCAPQPVVADVEGRFVIHCESVARKITARAPGFASTTVYIQDRRNEIRVQLKVAPMWSGTRVVGKPVKNDAITESGQAVRTMSEAELLASPQPTLDDALRNVAGFTLFRRSGSRIANPTSQGLSLRGIGASGASRALVLYDEVPLNDPFGGWVYWSRISREAISSVTVTQSGWSDFYGDQAMAGVVRIERRSPENSIRFTSEGGGLGSFAQTVSGGRRFGPVHTSGFFDLDATNGYVLVPNTERGAVDRPANARHSAGELRLEGDWKQSRVFVQGSGFGERRHNGTRLQNNDTQLFALVAGMDREIAGGSMLVRLDGSGQSYNQTFSSIASDRNSETLARLQHVPAQQAGLRVVWGKAASPHLLSVGGDLRQVKGFTQETIFIAGMPSSHVRAGGEQFFGGGFAQDLWKIAPRLTIGGTLRMDGWRNFGASARTAAVATPGLMTETRFPDRNETALDPRLSVVYGAGHGVSFFATGYRSFRAPRPNELYRAFRLGNVLTLANADLKAERLTGVDAGIEYEGHVHARVAFFFARVTDPIANVTLSPAPALITRQRQNAGMLESKGLQLSASAGVVHDWTVRGDYQFADSAVTAFAANPALIGKRIPQVPAHSLATSLTFARSGWTAVLNGRITSRQFDDDLNVFDLGGASSFDLYAAKRWNDHLETFFAAENLLDQRDLIARTPIPNLSLPFTARGGIRITIGHEPQRID